MVVILKDSMIPVVWLEIRREATCIPPNLQIIQNGPTEKALQRPGYILRTPYIFGSTAKNRYFLFFSVLVRFFFDGMC